MCGKQCVWRANCLAYRLLPTFSEKLDLFDRVNTPVSLCLSLSLCLCLSLSLSLCLSVSLCLSLSLTHTHTHTHTHTQRQTDRQTERHKNRQTKRERAVLGPHSCFFTQADKTPAGVGLDYTHPEETLAVRSGCRDLPIQQLYLPKHLAINPRISEFVSNDLKYFCVCKQ